MKHVLTTFGNNDFRYIFNQSLRTIDMFIEEHRRTSGERILSIENQNLIKNLYLHFKIVQNLRKTNQFIGK